MAPTVPHTVDPITKSTNLLPQRQLALYLHIPFCRTRCSYCAFNTYAGLDAWVAPYMRALRREIELVAGDARRPAHTVYFGGGTPSLLPVDEIAAVLSTISAGFDLAPGAEITLEANPGTVTQPQLTALRQTGVNRLSVGMQSAHDSELKLFARQHRLGDVRATVAMARSAGFENISLDLIYGNPRQTMGMWRDSLNQALTMAPTHLSLYSLSIEDATPMQRWIAADRLPAPDPDQAADMYEWASDRLAAAGYDQYEISNWARPGFACRHNVHVWRNRPYLGFGAGAHGSADHMRYANVLRPATYIERVDAQAAPSFPASAAADEIELIDERADMAETMFMGLRLTCEGISPHKFQTRYGRDLWAEFGEALDRLLAQGLLERTPDQRIRLTARGRLLGNRVFAEFV